ncbi:hypothetical protein SULI_14615 [Saccharolobus solfataricus]|uniref:PaREP6 n=5 Tax=Saccharolobus TaxID=2100760 RepID=A0A0E3MHQ4_SACSO|nr:MULTISPECIES: hypothetical protein [Saccharolobus]AKA74918.1 hypothetical protein SULB_2864 [Saccharolobus solfataricus]AKA77614.1 hypothetical protein SULC_2861 [Saccharolobus solfataricus]AKA80305.1 hypothetical protein SULA_2864 [Saccharolobus solfataricus]AZF69384.1 hypothetical protein SULG_14615 [Saccharolobus solfataricus]AZF72004.1 hypothetical protein SULH_14615 [Saccharolobus solfataricus]
MIDEEALKEWIERFKEAREIRRKYADWDFIKSQPVKLRIALEYYIETGDYRGASQMAGMAVDEFVDFAKDKAKIPTIY